MHIPDLVYKYYSLTSDDHLNELKLKTLNDKKVFMAYATELNDPSESKAYYYRNDVLRKFESLKLRFLMTPHLLVLSHLLQVSV